MNNYKLRVSIEITADYECNETMDDIFIVKAALRRITKNAVSDAIMREMLVAKSDTYDREFHLLDSNVNVSVSDWMVLG